MSLLFVVVLFIISLAVVVLFLKNGKINSKQIHVFNPEYKNILDSKINYYTQLEEREKVRFEKMVSEFLATHKIIGVECDVSIEDNLLVAASAIIPIFNFPNWKYDNLFEVYIYPEHFNENLEIKGKGKIILGMVGTGYMDGKMILSKKALHHGFKNETDKKNTAIHEFVHLIDKMDGEIDGVPKVLLDKQYILPWLDLMSQKMKEINKGKSDIDNYGGTSKIEFFTVASEYFFERPKLLSKKHPELYKLLEQVFKQNMVNVNFKKRKA